ncbi:hypothetical protein BT63DRAFT_261688 [Microthyrium microscopicum]|uniref:Uncharacterized protein n=1 Tax=Microthyrium microscopicum TaxID=703497 RepID=A0A6A6UB40_9PEZI|nr:hypothetical protein BT63DRAFT_261688 [Microthyrium microscopicum]
MSLCVWTSVHLNLPEHNKAYQQKWRKVKWLVIALFAPEVVAWIAFEQNQEAKRLRRKVREALGQPQARSTVEILRSWTKKVLIFGHTDTCHDQEAKAGDESTSTKRHLWSLTHSHFAIMGGFAFDTSRSEANFLPDGRTRLPLTSLGIHQLTEAAPSLLPDLSESEIKDKSKANGLGKTIVCSQALWFCLQCISRLAHGSAISLLELNTFAHALCTLLTYILWWNKPFDVEEPIVIRGLDADILCAGMCMRSSIGTIRKAAGFQPDKYLKGHIWFERHGEIASIDFGLLEALILHVQPNPDANARGLPIYADASCHWQGRLLQHDDRNQPELSSVKFNVTPAIKVGHDGGLKLQLYMGQSLFGFGFRRDKHDYFIPTSIANLFAGLFLDPTAASLGILTMRRPYVELNSDDILCFKLAASCYGKYMSVCRCPSPGSTYKHNPAHDHRKWWLREYMIPRVSNWPNPSINVDADDSFWLAMLSFTFAGLAYGSLHLLAWHAPLLTRTEVYMWRISGLFLAAYGGAFVMFVMALGLPFAYLGRSKWGQSLPRQLQDRLKVILGYLLMIPLLVIGAGGLLYVFARVFLVVECFISIPHLPDSVFEVPQWTQFFPHVI